MYHVLSKDLSAFYEPGILIFLNIPKETISSSCKHHHGRTQILYRPCAY
uniref:Uncharacterized protein n=1 Tax=Anguilla anguilla TaxID=7936 RepID=A0A0E9SZD5_ANGAN